MEDAIKMVSNLDPVALVEQVSYEFDNQNYKKVIQLCIEGIQTFGEFPLLYFFLIKSLIKSKNFNEAKDYLELAFNKFPLNRSIQSLKSEIETLSVLGKKDYQIDNSNKTKIDYKVEFERLLENSFIFSFRVPLNKYFFQKDISTKLFDI